MQYTDAVLSATHSATLRGSDMFFISPSVPPRCGSTLGYYCFALSGSEFLGLSARQSPIYCAEGGFFQNVADISILYKIFGTRVSGHPPHDPHMCRSQEIYSAPHSHIHRFALPFTPDHNIWYHLKKSYRKSCELMKICLPEAQQVSKICSTKEIPDEIRTRKTSSA